MSRKVTERCPVCGDVNDADKEHNCGVPSPAGMRIEYEYPPMRAIHATWFEEEPQFTDDEMKDAFLAKHPRAKIRKIERNVPRHIAISRGWHNEEFDV